MDTVSAIAARSSYDTTSSAGAKSTNISADYDTFLTLLVTQLQNQDPTKPTDNAEFISQLASFSAVEQQTQTNDRLDTLIGYFNMDQGAALLGKQITSADGSVTGIVDSVKITDEGIVATLESGDTVLIEPGIEIANAG